MDVFSNLHSRRDFMKLSAAALGASAVAAACGGEAAPAASAAGADIPNGVQLYCVRHQIEEQGLEPILEELAAIGYEGVEFADYHGHTAEELRAMLDRTGLRACGSHVYLETMLGDELQRSIDFHQTLGNRWLVVRWMGEELRDTEEAFMNTCETFNEVAAGLKPHGMRVGYHNHGYIFETFQEGGPTLWELFADNTVDDVFLQLDTGNAASHADTIELLRRDTGRFASMHIKPWDPENRDAFLGEDALDWPAILDIANTTGGVDWYIVEYERDAFPPLDALATNLQNFKQIRGA